MVALKVLKYEIQVFVSPRKSDIDLFITRKQDGVIKIPDALRKVFILQGTCLKNINS